MVEWWVAVLTALMGAGLGYLSHLAQARIATRDNQDTLAEAKRTAALEHMRWAMDMLVSEDERSRALGAAQLKALAASPYLTEDELRLIWAATDSALEPALEEWDNEQVADGEEEQP